MLTPGPVSRTRAPVNGRLFDSRTLAMIVERFPTCSWRGVIVSEEHTAGGVNAPCTVVHSVAELFAVFDSASAPTTVAVLQRSPVAVGVAMIVIVTVAPAATVPMLQVTTPPAAAQVPCVVEAETKFTVAGSGSAAVTPVAVLGPAFVTVSV